MISASDRILAAVSGGADSMCMLSLLLRYSAEYGTPIGVVHVDHGFRAESAAEAAYVESFCGERDVPFFLKRIEPGTCKSSEEEARIRRYELISEVMRAEGYTEVALAHNASDRAETVLFNLFRGTGASGLTGIRPVRGEFIRPIMCLGRAEIEAYLQTEGIDHCTDATNLGDDYSRNRIRHHIIPEAVSINAGAVNHINEAAEDLEDLKALVNGLAKEAYEKAVTADGEGGAVNIALEVYQDLNAAVRTELIRMVISGMTPHLKDVTREHILSVDRLAARSTNGGVDLPYGIRAEREYGNLRICPPVRGEMVTSATGEHVRFRHIDVPEGSDPCALIISNTYTKRFDYDKMNELPVVRYRKPDDRMTIDVEGHTKPLSRVMIDARIPERIRDDIPLVAIGSDIVWIVGYRDSCAYRIDDDTVHILEIDADHTK